MGGDDEGRLVSGWPFRGARSARRICGGRSMEVAGDKLVTECLSRCSNYRRFRVETDEQVRP